MSLVPSIYLVGYMCAVRWQDVLGSSAQYEPTKGAPVTVYTDGSQPESQEYNLEALYLSAFNCEIQSLIN